MTSQCRKNFVSIPRPPYPEVKGYIEDLPNRGFISNSSSPFSCSVVCVRKKDGGMRLCVDYRELNKKTVPDLHPIPRIKEALGRLGGNSWFSIFDQGKPYHQGLISKQNQPLPPLNAPANFQRFMEDGLRELRDEMCPLFSWYGIFRVIFIAHWTPTQGTSTLKESWGEVESSYV